MKRSLYQILIYLIIGSLSLLATPGKKERAHVPLSVSIKQVLETIQMQKAKNIECLGIQQLGILPVESLQRKAADLLTKPHITKDDIAQIAVIVSQMKSVVLMFLSNDCASQVLSVDSKKTCAELLEQAIAVVDLLTAKAVEYDIAYLKESLQKLQLSIDKTIDRKLTVRLLSIIEEIMQKHDEVFVTTYNVLLLSQLALNIFLVGVIC